MTPDVDVLLEQMLAALVRIEAKLDRVEATLRAQTIIAGVAMDTRAERHLHVVQDAP